MIRTIIGRAETAKFHPNTYDLVLTSPPAYPSPLQPLGNLGTESTLAHYLSNLGVVLRQLRRNLRPTGILCLVIEPQEGHNIMEPLATLLASIGYRSLGLYAWNHPPTNGSWIVFLAPPGRARLTSHPALNAKEWLIPYDSATHGYVFYEFPQALVDTILAVTCPTSGNVLDPFAGPAKALRTAATKGPWDLTLVEPDYPEPQSTHPEATPAPGPS